MRLDACFTFPPPYLGEKRTTARTRGSVIQAGRGPAQQCFVCIPQDILGVWEGGAQHASFYIRPIASPLMYEGANFPVPRVSRMNWKKQHPSTTFFAVLAG